jgi:hypothetical protein
MILDRQHILWEDIEVIGEFGQCFCHAVNLQHGNQPTA